MTNELDKAAVEKAYESWSETYCIRLTKKGKADFGKHIQVYLDETKLQEKLKIAEEALEIVEAYIGENLDKALYDSLADTVEQALKQIGDTNA